MNARHILVAVLATCFAMVLCFAFWLAEVEPYPMEIVGQSYDETTEPYISEDLVNSSVAGELMARVVLIGDAGDPIESNRETMAALNRWTAANPERTTTVFLGDNLYRYGLDPHDRAAGQAIIEAQLRSAAGRKIIIPGNHDWGHTAGMRIERILAMQDVIDAWPDAEFIPRDGCSGPASVELVPSGDGLAYGVTLVAVDTTWLLRPADRPDCHVVHYQVMNRLRDELSAHPGDLVIVIGHHPFLSSGPHGGFERSIPRRAWQTVVGAQDRPAGDARNLVARDPLGPCSPRIHVA
jgi:hypothetical protein